MLSGSLCVKDVLSKGHGRLNQTSLCHRASGRPPNTKSFLFSHGNLHCGRDIFFSLFFYVYGSDYLFTTQTSCWLACSVAFFFLNQKLHAELNGWRQIINNEKKWVATGEWTWPKFFIFVYGKHHTRRSNFHAHMCVCVAFHQWASNRTDTTLGCTRLSLSCEAFIITWQLPSPSILTASAHALRFSFICCWRGRVLYIMIILHMQTRLRLDL